MATPAWPFLREVEDDGPLVRETKLALKDADLMERHRATAAAAVRAAGMVDHIDETGLNPAGKLDNVSLALFLKYMQLLGLVPAAPVRGRPPATPETAPTPAEEVPGAEVVNFRKRARDRHQAS